MKKFANKFVTAALSAAMVATLVFPTTVSASWEDGKAFIDSKSYTAYAPSKVINENYWSSTSFTVSNAKKTTKIKNFKSSNKKVVAPYYIEKNKSKYSYDYHYLEDGREDEKGESEYYSLYCGVKFFKPGKAKLSVNIDGVDNKIDIAIKKYVNPVASCKISSLNNGKELKNMTKDTRYTEILKPNKKATKTSIKIKPSKNFKITRVYYSNYTTGQNLSIGYGYSNAVSAVNLNTFKISPKDEGYIDVSYIDKDGVAQSISYSFRPNN